MRVVMCMRMHRHMCVCVPRVHTRVAYACRMCVSHVCVCVERVCASVRAPRREPGAEMASGLAPVVLRPRVRPEAGGAAKSVLAFRSSPALACTVVGRQPSAHEAAAFST